MTLKRSCSLNTKANWYFYAMIEICLAMINENIFIAHLCLKTSIKILPRIYQNKTEVPGKSN